jgi:anti-sigma factor RsiW
MKHEPYEDWIFGDDPLTEDAQTALKAHLRECDECFAQYQNWTRVEHLLRQEPVAKPAAGFAARWEEHQLAEQRRREVRQSIGMLAFSAVGAAFFLALFFSTGDFALHPAAILRGAARVMLEAQRALFAAYDLAPAVHIHGLEELPAYWAMAFFALTGLAGILWLRLFRVFARYQGFRQWV